MSKELIEKLRVAQSVVLSTHRSPDGDGLGAQLALFYALKKKGLHSRLVNVDPVSRKYDFLGFDEILEIYQPGQSLNLKADLALILDTNDSRLVEPLYSELKSSCRDVVFIDHHPILAKGPMPDRASIIDITAASTGELCYRLIKELGIPLDAKIARALYTSLVFDTQLFRFVRSSPASHLMAADLLIYEREPEVVHRKLFAHYSRSLADALGKVEYFYGEKVAFIPFRLAAAPGPGDLERDESGDIIDKVMEIASIEIAALLREDGPGSYKLSLRSRGTVEVLGTAEKFGGGGHRYASGAYLKGSFNEWREKILAEIHRLLPLKDFDGSADV